MPRRAAVVRLALAVAALALCGACKVDVSVAIDAANDGTGDVRVNALLDRKAVEAIGDLDAQLEFDDLTDAGWEIEGPDSQEGGGAEIVARHRFASTAEAGRLLVDVSGVDGPLQKFAVEQERGFFKTRTEFRGTVDLEDGLGSFSDAALAALLGGQPLGVTEEQLERRLGEPLDRFVGLQIAADLPGTVESNAPTQAGGSAVWAPKLGEQLALDATAEQWNVRNIALLAVAVAAWVALAVVVASRRRMRSAGA